MWLRRKSRIKPIIAACLNCGHPFEPSDNFCASCGQTRTDGKVTFKALIKDAFTDILNIDSRIFLSLRGIIAPGRLTHNFFAGKHQTYYPPARFFFVSLVIHFAIFGFVINRSIQDSIPDVTQSTESKVALEKKAIIDSVIYRLQSFDSTDTLFLVELDSLRLKYEIQGMDSIDITYFNWFDSGYNKSLKIAKVDLDAVNGDILENKYGIKGIEKYSILQVIRAMKNPTQMIRFMISNCVWMILALIPLLALFMKLLYIRSEKFFVEHIVFLFHIHVFSFLVVSVYLILSIWIGNKQILIPILVCLGYIYLSIKQFYQQGYFKSFIKFALIGLVYFIIIIILFGITVLLSILFFS